MIIIRYVCVAFFFRKGQLVSAILQIPMYNQNKNTNVIFYTDLWGIRSHRRQESLCELKGKQTA